MTIEKFDDVILRKLKRDNLSVEKTDEGYTIKPPEHRGLVISGAGAKGVTYIGMVKALYDADKVKGLTHVCGASAGSIISSLIAFGMTSDQISKFSQELDVSKLLDKEGGLLAKGERLQNVLELVYMLKMKEHLNNIKTPVPKEFEQKDNDLKNKIDFLETSLKHVGISINSVDDILKVTKSPKQLKALDSVFKALPIDHDKSKGSPRITFNDLIDIRTLLPEDKKHSIKNLSIVVTNQTKGELERYGEDTSPQESVSQIVQWSSAHPLLFAPGKKKNEEGKVEYMADGGILNNMPPAIGQGINEENTLVIKTDTEQKLDTHINRAKRHNKEGRSAYDMALDKIYKLLVGGHYIAGKKAQWEREKVYYNCDNMVYLSSGTVETTNMAPTQKMKNDAIRNGEQQTNDVLRKQTMTFKSPLMAMLYAGENTINLKLKNEQQEPELFEAAIHARIIFKLQHEVLNELKRGDYSLVEHHLEEIEQIIDRNEHLKDDKIGKQQAFALCLKQINFMSEDKLYDYIDKISAEEQASKRPGWATRIKELLLTPITLLLSLYEKPNANLGLESETPNQTNTFKTKLIQMKHKEEHVVKADVEIGKQIHPQSK